MEEKLEEIYRRFKEDEGNLISILQDIQDEFCFIPESVISWFSERLNVPPAMFYGLATFYAQFHLRPRGKNVITICSGTACHVKGSEKLVYAAMRELRISDENATTEDCLFSLERVNCVGACSIAPVVVINKKVFGKMTPDRLVTELKGLEELG